MLGTFQHSSLRIELAASQQQIRDSLVRPAQFRQWLAPQTFSAGLPDSLQAGTVFTSWLGPVPVRHQVEQVEPNSIRLVMSQGIDGFHQWYWGEGWVESNLEGWSLAAAEFGADAQPAAATIFLEPALSLKTTLAATRLSAAQHPGT